MRPVPFQISLSLLTLLRKRIGRSVRCACVGLSVARASYARHRAQQPVPFIVCLSLLELPMKCIGVLGEDSYVVLRGYQNFFGADLGIVEDWIRNAWKSKGECLIEAQTHRNLRQASRMAASAKVSTYLVVSLLGLFISPSELPKTNSLALRLLIFSV